MNILKLYEGFEVLKYGDPCTKGKCDSNSLLDFPLSWSLSHSSFRELKHLKCYCKITML